jgi:hypothetical protein
MGRAALVGACARPQNRRRSASVTESLPLLETEIRSLLDLPATGRPPREVVEHTLTSGYAHLLRLDAERLRTEQRLRSLVRSGRYDPAGHDELTRALGVVDQELARLRALLSSLRDQAL